MNTRERADLDRHITGNYGEDQLREPTAAHTPGPWHFVDEGGEMSVWGGADVDTDDQPTATQICILVDNADAPANGNLIAAAPALAEALRNVLLEFEYDGGISLGARNQARDALKSAGIE